MILTHIQSAHKGRSKFTHKYLSVSSIINTKQRKGDNITVDAGAQIEARCVVTLPNINPNHIRAEVYYGKFLADGTVQDVKIIPMQMERKDEENKKYHYVAKIDLKSGGNYGYSFRVMPEHEMILESANLDLVKWVEKQYKRKTDTKCVGFCVKQT